jgi:nitroreductase
MKNPVKRASTDSPIVELLAMRYSPYVFEPRPVDEGQLLACLEAARWAPSSYNEQPWSFLVARRTHADEFAQMLSCLLEANQAWAQYASVLLLTVVCQTFSRNGKPNRVAEHDVGLAAANFAVQATALGLAVHQMAGVDLDKARRVYQIPDTHQPLTGIALGHAATPQPGDSDPLAHRDLAPRTRKPLSEIVFAGQWARKAAFVDASRSS